MSQRQSELHLNIFSLILDGFLIKSAQIFRFADGLQQSLSPRYLSDRKVLGYYYYVLVPNRPKITLTNPTDRIGTPITL